MIKAIVSAAVIAAGMFFSGPALAADSQFNVPLDCDDHDVIVMGIMTLTEGVTFADMSYDQILTVIYDEKLLTPDQIVGILAEYGFVATLMGTQEKILAL